MIRAIAGTSKDWLAFYGVPWPDHSDQERQARVERETKMTADARLAEQRLLLLRATLTTDVASLNKEQIALLLTLVENALG